MPNKSITGALALARDPLRAYQRVLGVAISGSSLENKEQLLGSLRRSDFGSLLKWSGTVSPQLYETPAAYFTAAQISSLIKKYPFTEVEVPGINPEATAVKKFLQAEHRCKRVNQKRRALRKSQDVYIRFRTKAQDYIKIVLGATPDFQTIYDLCDFTSGASLGVHGNKTNVARKVLSQRWTVTPSALYHAKRALWSNIHTRDCILPGAIKCYDTELFSAICKERVQFVDYNMISFVPKTAVTHRSIAVEPLLNGYVQKGADEFIRRRLRRHTPIDLSDQSTNQALALLGSRGGYNPYCTLDLSAASDSLSLEVVRDLLPPEWFEFLCEIRSPCYRLDPRGASVRYEKFCSMGNGFCFPLQTLIFASICFAVSSTLGDPQDFIVYGDDIIVRQNMALLVIELLREIGFRVNTDKTFITGPFRESCGADWYNGQDVRPVYLTKPLLDVQEVFALHNTFLRSQRTELFSEEIREELINLVPPPWRFMRPGREPGDSAFSVPLDIAMCSPYVAWVREDIKRGWSQVWVWKEIKTSPNSDEGIRTLSEVERANVLVLAAMRGSPSQNPFPVRYDVTRKAIRVSRRYSERYDKVDLRFGGITSSGPVTHVQAEIRQQYAALSL